jgi:hypothetical protein
MESSAREYSAPGKRKQEHIMDIAFAIAVIEEKIKNIEARIEAEADPTGRAVLCIKADAYREILAEVEPMANA